MLQEYEHTRELSVSVQPPPTQKGLQCSAWLNIDSVTTIVKSFKRLINGVGQPWIIRSLKWFELTVQHLALSSEGESEMRELRIGVGVKLP